MSEIRTYKLEDLGFLGRGKSRHRPRNDASLFGGKYPFIQTGEVKAAEFYINSYEATYNEKGLEQSKLWDPGTLLITIAANIAETAILDIKACFPDSILGFIPDEDKADVRYIKYYIDTIKLRMQSISKGTTQDNLSLEKLRSIDFEVPTLETQQKIASILSAFDDLIENNTRRIAILEETARLIYREWFVHYRYPGHEKDHLVDSETDLGEVPEGWEVKKILDVCELQTGKALKSKQFNEDGIGTKAVRIRNVRTNSSDTYTDEDFDGKYLVENGDILVGMDGDFHMCRWADGQSVLVQRVARFRSKNDVNLSKYFFYWAIKKPIDFFNKTITGTTVAHLGKKHIKTIEIVLPPKEEWEKINKVFDPLYEQELFLRKKNKTLKKARDLLLPKLISGKIEVEDININ